MLRPVTCVFIAVATVCVSNLARAQDDFSRAGCYLGAAGTFAYPLGTEDGLKDLTGWNADVDDSFGIHFRAAAAASGAAARCISNGSRASTPRWLVATSRSMDGR